jgi:predicted alpha/beta hydrolase family esterase
MADAYPNKIQVLFIQGGGEGGYEADAKLAASLQERLGANYNVRYPRMRVDEAAPDFGWGQQIDRKIAATKGKVILVGHSLGASILLKYLTEHKVKHRIGGIFLISTPFWSGDEEWQKGLKLREDFAKTLPKDVPIFLYHSRDDEEVSLANLAMYAKRLTGTIREVPSGGHQLGNDLTQVALDIKRL